MSIKILSFFSYQFFFYFFPSFLSFLLPNVFTSSQSFGNVFLNLDLLIYCVFQIASVDLVFDLACKLQAHRVDQFTFCTQQQESNVFVPLTLLNSLQSSFKRNISSSCFYNYYFTPWEFFILALAGGLSLEFE